MKIRTKLIGLLSGLLLLVILVTTLGGWFVLRSRVENSVREDAQSMAGAIATSLEDYLTAERSDEELTNKLEDLRRRYPSVVQLALSFATAAGETVQVLMPIAGEVEVSRPKGPRKPHSERAVQYEARRSLWEHGDSLRAPTARASEPLWRLSERGASTRWSRFVPVPVAAHRNRDIKTREERQVCQQPQRCLTMSTPLDPWGPQRGTLEVTVMRDRYNRVLQVQLSISAFTTLAALIILLVSTYWIVNAVVARPVSDLEQAMYEVEQGDLRRRVRLRRSDEVGNLGRGFNAMLDRLTQADEEIRGLNARLADDIAAATRDLQHKNEALYQLNQLLVQTQRELYDKERLAALGQLAAQLAHEVGTPLASVSAHLQLATFAPDAPAALRERLQVAIGELGRVSKIIRDYLDQTRTAKPTLVQTDLRRVVEEAVRVAGSAARAPVTRIVTRIDPRTEQIATDPGLLRQILINLLTNALDATAASPGGTNSGPVRDPADLDDAEVLLTVAPAGEEKIEITVQDHGTGIAPEDLARIFEPFYTTKGRGKGTGLGLSICRELARTLGGRLSVTSQPGHGSEFSVVLPRNLVQAA